MYLRELIMWFLQRSKTLYGRECFLTRGWNLVEPCGSFGGSKRKGLDARGSQPNETTCLEGLPALFGYIVL